jgi:hypothetical protein
MTMQLFVPITKIDAAKRLVYGTIAEEIPDRSGELFDYRSSKPYFEQWSGEIAKASEGRSVGNLRAMHGAVAAGKLSRLSFDDAGKRIEAVGKVVDDAEWAKVLEGVYTGFSIGGHYVRRWPDGENPALTRYTAEPSEVSLVDNPCIPSATFSVVKADGSVERRAFKAPALAPREPRQTWDCGTPGHAHLAKLEAARCIEAQRTEAASISAEPSDNGDPESSAGPTQMSRATETTQDDDGIDGTADEPLDKDGSETGDENEEDEGSRKVLTSGALTKMLARRDALHRVALARGLAERDAQLEALRAEHAAGIAALEKRLASLEAQPAEARGRLKLIEKGQDLSAVGVQALDIDPADTVALIKRAQQNPRRIVFG